MCYKLDVSFYLYNVTRFLFVELFYQIIQNYFYEYFFSTLPIVWIYILVWLSKRDCYDNFVEIFAIYVCEYNYLYSYDTIGICILHRFNAQTFYLLVLNYASIMNVQAMWLRIFKQLGYIITINEHIYNEWITKQLAVFWRGSVVGNTVVGMFAEKKRSFIY